MIAAAGPIPTGLFYFLVGCLMALIIVSLIEIARVLVMAAIEWLRG